MSILVTNEIKIKLEELTKGANSSVFVITAFAKDETIRWINSITNQNVIDKRIIIRCRVSDFISGASDFSVLKYCLDNGWKTFIDTNLHAKVYIFDNNRAIVSSSNLTQRGLGFSQENNREIGVQIELTNEDKGKIAEIFESSCILDNDLIVMMTDVLKKITEDQIIEPESFFDWPEEIHKKLTPQNRVLFLEDFPSCENSKLTDEDDYGFIPCKVTDDYSVIEKCFKCSRVYKWLLLQLEKRGTLFFGELTQIVHDSLLCDSVYRSVVKERLSNLLGWVSEFCSDEIVIDIPSHSTRVTLNRS